MQAGKLNRLVALQRRVDGADSIGQPSASYQEVVKVWADVRHRSGSETIRSGAVMSTVVASVRIRPYIGANAGMRVVDGLDTFEIKSVLRGREHYDLICEAVS